MTALDRTGSGLKVSLTDTATHKTYVIGVSDTVFSIWGATDSAYHVITAKRIAKALNDKLQGEGTGEYMFTDNNSG